MAENVVLFSEQEKVFLQKTGKDFSTLYKKYYPKLIYFTSKMCKDPQIAEDITTDSFMTAFEKIEKYESEKSQFSTWLFTIAKNLALQSIKSENRKISLDIEYDEEGTTMKDFIPQDDEDGEIYYDVVDKKADIMLKHIGKLKGHYKKVIEMREIKKMSYQDIADELDTNLSTIKSRIRMGRAILIKESKKEFDILDNMYL